MADVGRFEGLWRCVRPLARWREWPARTVRFISTLALIAVLWTASDIGYYLLLPTLGIQASYNLAAVAITLYYVFWIGVAVIAFWPVYATWSRYARWATFENRLTSLIVWSLAFIGSITFAAYVLPLLPPVNWTEPWQPPEFVRATPWYFLPKSVDILFQQLLIVALVLTLAARRYDMRAISIVCALGFGAAHLLLAFGDVPWRYVFRLMLAASLFGLAFPYLILRVPNGVAYSYMVHWLYYAVSVALPHIFLSSPQ